MGTVSTVLAGGAAMVGTLSDIKNITSSTTSMIKNGVEELKAILPVQSRSTEKDSVQDNYQGLQMDFYSGKRLHQYPQNSLDAFFGREFLSWEQIVDLDELNGRVEPYNDSTDHVLKVMTFPRDGRTADSGNCHSTTVTVSNTHRVYQLSPWAAYRSNFGESRCKVRLRLKFLKTKYHTLTVRITCAPASYIPTANNVDTSRNVIKEFTLIDSNEIEWEQPSIYSPNDWDHSMQVMVQIYNTTVTNSVSKDIGVQCYVTYSDCSVSGFNGMGVVPYYCPDDFEFLALNQGTKVLKTPSGVFPACSPRWEAVMRSLLIGRNTKFNKALEDYEAFDVEKFKNLFAAYSVTPNFYDLGKQILDTFVTFDAAGVGEFLIKWNVYLRAIVAVHPKAYSKIIPHFTPRFYDLLANLDANENEIITYLKRLLPPIDIIYTTDEDSVPTTVEEVCRPLSRCAFANMTSGYEAKGCQFIPSRLWPSYLETVGSDDVSLSFLQWFAPHFLGNIGSYHVRFQPSSDNLALSHYSGVGNVVRVKPNSKPIQHQVELHRHNTVGDSLLTADTPVYLHVPPHARRPTLHTMSISAFDTKKAGGDIPPIPAAQCTLVKQPREGGVHAEVHMKPGEDFAFVYPIGFMDYCKNDEFASIMAELSGNTELPVAQYNQKNYDFINKFTP